MFWRDKLCQFNRMDGFKLSSQVKYTVTPGGFKRWCFSGRSLIAQGWEKFILNVSYLVCSPKTSSSGNQPELLCLCWYNVCPRWEAEPPSPGNTLCPPLRCPLIKHLEGPGKLTVLCRWLWKQMDNQLFHADLSQFVKVLTKGWSTGIPWFFFKSTFFLMLFLRHWECPRNKCKQLLRIHSSTLQRLADQRENITEESQWKRELAKWPALNK